MLSKVKTFLLPSNVTWKSKKNTIKDSFKVMSVSVVIALAALLGDIVASLLIGLIL